MWHTLRNITLVIILFIFIRYLFDENPYNDRIGWSVMIVFWISKGVFDAIEDKKKGNKKSMAANVVFVTAGLGVLCWQGIQFFS